LSIDLVIAIVERFYALISRGQYEKELQFSHGGWTNLRRDFISPIKGYICYGEDALATLHQRV